MPKIGDDRVEIGPYTIRPWESADVVWVYEACQDPSIQRWTRVPAPYRPSDAVDLVAASASERASGRGAPMAIVQTETGELLGSTGLVRVDWTEGVGEIGYWLDTAARGRGVMTTVLPGLAAWAFETLGLEVVEARVEHGNLDSERVLARAGFVRVGDTHCRADDGDPDASLWEIRRVRAVVPMPRQHGDAP